jgi:GT2 family glycosyltransferase
VRLAYVIVDWRTPRLAAAARDSILAFRPLAMIATVDAYWQGLSYSEACNWGARIVGDRADILCFLNADVEMIEKDLAIPAMFEADHDLAILGPRQVNAVDKVVHGGIVPHEDETEWHIDPRSRCWMWPLEEAEELTAGTFEAVTVPGSVMYVRRESFEALGRFPTWTKFYYEDTFLCYLARHRGLRVLYSGAVTWRHLGEGSPLRAEDRTERMRIAREEFIRRCRAEGVPLEAPDYVDGVRIS